MAGRRMPSGQRRTQLVTKAQEAFLEGGYRGTTTKDVALAAGVSEALVVKHFGSKEELFRQSMVDPLLGMLNEVLHKGPPVGVDVAEHRQTLFDFYRDWATVIRTEGHLLWAVLREAQDFPDTAATIAGLFRTHVEEVAAMLAQTIDREQFREFDMEVATYMGLGAATVAGMIGGDPESFVNQIVGILFRGVLTPAGRIDLDHAELPSNRAALTSAKDPRQPKADVV